MGEIALLQRYIDETKKIVFFGGAGVSTESGIKDFRSADGLYKESFKYSPEYMLSHSCFVKHTLDFFEFYKAKMLPIGISPNAAHYKLAELERANKIVGVVTQNIDGLHQKAGSEKVFELHGSVLRNYCVDCGAFYDLDYVRLSDGVPYCKKCGGVVKPDVVLYEEALNGSIVEGAIRAIMNADTMIIAGTSLEVYPANGLINYFGGRRLIVINRDEINAGGRVDLFIKGNVGETLGKIKVN